MLWKQKNNNMRSSFRDSESCDHVCQSSSIVKFNCSHKSASKNGILRASNLSGHPSDRKLLGKTFSYAGECSYDVTISDIPVSVAQEKDIIRLPRPFRFLQRPLAQLISVLRAPKSQEGYASIGGGSPLRRITDEQAHALKLALESKNVPANVYVAMRYCYPFTEEAVDQIKRDGISRLIVLPFFPQFSISTSGSSSRLLQDIFRKDSYLGSLPVSIIESWYQRVGYIKSMADLIEGELQSFAKLEEVVIFFTAHGVPVSYVDSAGDPYRDQMEECVSLIMEELKSRSVNNKHTLAYQGVKSLLAVPISFVSEHIETLEEIDMEYKELALESGIENWGRVPALGCTPLFISDLADAVIEALPSATATMATRRETGDDDLLKTLVYLFLGSILAFVLLFSPKLISVFKGYLQ